MGGKRECDPVCCSSLTLLLGESLFEPVNSSRSAEVQQTEGGELVPLVETCKRHEAPPTDTPLRCSCSCTAQLDGSRLICRAQVLYKQFSLLLDTLTAAVQLGSRPAGERAPPSPATRPAAELVRCTSCGSTQPPGPLRCRSCDWCCCFRTPSGVCVLLAGSRGGIPDRLCSVGTTAAAVHSCSSSGECSWR